VPELTDKAQERLGEAGNVAALSRCLDGTYKPGDAGGFATMLALEALCYELAALREVMTPQWAHQDCPVCSGSGKDIRDCIEIDCPDCGGRGWKRVPR
jgi:hypothetical protein